MMEQCEVIEKLIQVEMWKAGVPYSLAMLYERHIRVLAEQFMRKPTSIQYEGETAHLHWIGEKATVTVTITPHPF